MFKNLLQPALLLSALFASAHASANVCVDDPRMFTIKTVLNQVNQGQAIKPIKLTPETFLTLTPVVRKALGDNITVYNDQCVPQQIYQGNLAKRIELPYETLRTAIHSALVQNNLPLATTIIHNFIAEPRTQEQIITLINPIVWGNKITSRFYKLGFLEQVGMVNDDWEKPHRKCRTLLADISNIELFVALGGRAQSPDISPFRPQGTVFNYTFYGRNIFISPNIHSYEVEKLDNTKCSPLNSKRILSSLTQTGLTVVKVINKDESDKLYRQFEQNNG